MIMKKPTIVLQNFIVSLICLTVCDSASWLQKGNHAHHFELGDEIDFNCNLTDPKINVTLWRSNRQVVPDGRHVQQFNQMFRMVNLTVADGGLYQCQAENMTSLDVLEVHMTHDGIPKPKPKITHQPRKIAYGKEAKLKCSATGSSLTLTWYKSKPNGTRSDWQLMNTEKSSTSTTRFGKRETIRYLTIKKFNVSDNGQYICELRRFYVKWRAKAEMYVGIGDFQKPGFLNFPGSLVTVNNGRVSISKQYEVVGVPPPIITWYKISSNQEEKLCECDVDFYCCDENYFDITKKMFRKYYLSFPSDNATFKCVASNSLGRVSKTFRLNVLAKPTFTKSPEDLSFLHVYNNSLETEIICKVDSANPNQMRFRWEAQSASCYNSDCRPNNSMWKVITERESGIRITSSHDRSTLTLTNFEAHSFYRCTAINSVGEDNHMWKVVPVKGLKPLKAVETSKVVNEKENVKLSCEVARFTYSKVHWSFNSVPLHQSPHKTMVNSSINGTVYSTLNIINVSVSDSGKYKCFGKFNGINIQDQIQLTVRELKAPTVSLKKITATQGSSFYIRCNVSGYPEPQITWKKEGKIIEESGTVDGKDKCKSMVKGIYVLSTAGETSHAKTLVICHADYEKHSAQFSCTARNEFGNDTAKAFISINAPPVVYEFPKKDIVLGENFLLKCRTSGNPKPHVWWEKKDEKTLAYKRFVSKHSDELHFSPLEERNLGSYRCVAQYGDKNSTREFKLVPSPVTGKKVADHVAMSNEYPIVIGCVSFFILAIVIVVAIVLYKRKKAYGGFYILTLPPYPDYIKKLDPHTPITEQTNKLPYDAEWEFPRNRLKFSRELGSGAFGTVFLADALGIVAFDPRGSTKKRSSRRRFGGSVRRNHYVNNNKTTKVAVKTLKEDSGETEYKDLLSELKILIHVGEHKNIVNLLGACTKGRESELWVIIEYCSNGNLLQFLRNRRDIYGTEWKGVSKDPNVQLTMTDLVVAAYQVARGMEFLASRLCIHRDLATRNILVTDNYVIKIADFGLARDVGEDCQYVKTSTGLLPVKWMAIEAIVQRLFTEKSDVWSFGIVLWELFTLGGTPYPNIPPNEVAEFLVRGLRMEPPHACPDEISTLMMKCWHEDKDCRPTFKELVEILDKIIELHTSSEGGCGYLEVQGEVMNEYLSPSEVKTPEMDPFECNSPLPPIPSPGDNENDSLLHKDQNARNGKFRFDKAMRNKGRKDSEIEKMQNDHRPEILKDPDVKCLHGNPVDGYIDTSLTGKEKERIARDLDKDRDSSEEPPTIGDYAYWKKSLV